MMKPRRAPPPPARPGPARRPAARPWRAPCLVQDHALLVAEHRRPPLRRVTRRTSARTGGVGADGWASVLEPWGRGRAVRPRKVAAPPSTWRPTLWGVVSSCCSAMARADMNPSRKAVRTMRRSSCPVGKRGRPCPGRRRRRPSFSERRTTRTMTLWSTPNRRTTSGIDTPLGAPRPAPPAPR